MSRSLTIAIAQLHPHKGDYRANLDRLRDIFAQVRMLSPHPQVLHFPETVLSGYFVEGGVRDVAVTAGTLARDLDQVFADGPKDDRARRPLDVVVGFYEKWRDNLYNSAAYIRLGEGAARILHVHRKNFLPTYGLFDEERFVERGHTQRAFDTPWGGRAAMLVCEDAWHSITGTVAALDGAQVIFVLAAAPARGLQSREGVPGPGSLARWERLVRDIADEHGVFVSLANLAGSEGGKVFAGGSCLAGPRGDLRVRAPAFEEAILTLTIDLGDITRARSDMPLLSDLRTQMPHLRRTMDAVESQASVVAAFDAAEADGVPRGAPPESEYPSKTADSHHRGNGGYIIPAHHVPRDAHGGPPSLDIEPSMVEEWLVRFLRDEMGRRGFAKAVIGLSGGVDSAVTAYLAARAIGPENVLGVRLPYRTSSPESLAHAQLVVDMLGIPSRTIDLSAAADGYLALEPTADGTRRGNVIARLRMIALFDLSAAVGGVPLGTGNKTERLFGYFTWHADDSPPLNPLGDLFKTQVWALARHLGVPDVIVGKPATADLVAGQTDEADFGIAYARADTILNWLLWGFSTADLVARGFPEYEVELVRNRLERTHWKRKLPTVALLSHTAIGESYLRPVDY
ncbi:MAG TPA: NAD(+) synthase [Gemmatimonadaceae bacterium]